MSDIDTTFDTSRIKELLRGNDDNVTPIPVPIKANPPCTDFASNAATIVENRAKIIGRDGQPEGPAVIRDCRI